MNTSIGWSSELVFLALNPDLIVYLFDTAAASVFEIYDHLVKPISFCADVTNSDS